jgi:flagellar protein FlbD
VCSATDNQIDVSEQQRALLNADLIEHIELRTDTVVALTNGAAFVVKERAEEILERIVQFQKRAFQARVNPVLALKESPSKGKGGGILGSCIDCRDRLRAGSRSSRIGRAVRWIYHTTDTAAIIVRGGTIRATVLSFPLKSVLSATKIGGYGEHQPVASNASAESRRVLTWLS